MHVQVYVRMYVFMYVCSWHIFCNLPHNRYMHIHVYVFLHVCMYVFMYVCMYVPDMSVIRHVHEKRRLSCVWLILYLLNWFFFGSKSCSLLFLLLMHIHTYVHAYMYALQGDSRRVVCRNFLLNGKIKKHVCRITEIDKDNFKLRTRLSQKFMMMMLWLLLTWKTTRTLWPWKWCQIFAGDTYFSRSPSLFLESVHSFKFSFQGHGHGHGHGLFVFAYQSTFRALSLRWIDWVRLCTFLSGNRSCIFDIKCATIPSLPESSILGQARDPRLQIYSPWPWIWLRPWPWRRPWTWPQLCTVHLPSGCVAKMNITDRDRDRDRDWPWPWPWPWPQQASRMLMSIMKRRSCATGRIHAGMLDETGLGLIVHFSPLDIAKINISWPWLWPP